MNDLQRAAAICRAATLAVAFTALCACSVIGPYTAHEKELLYRPVPKDADQKLTECNVLRAHYDWSLFIIKQRDENGWQEGLSKDEIVSDAWADYHRAKRIGCSGW